jgi:hypothetical protein
MPIPTDISGTPVIGFSDAKTFFIGYTGSGTYPLRGLGWGMTDTPAFKTLDQTTQGGREVMNSLYLNPLHAFKLVYNFLENDPALSISGNPDTDFRLLYSFYLAMNGRFQEFLYQTREASVVKQALALPDSNGYVELVYSNGPFFQESVQEMNNVLATIYSYDTVSHVYTDRTIDCSFYTAASIAPYSGVTFTSTYTLGANEVFAWTGTWYYRVHFAKDSYSFEEFLYAVMKTGVDLQQVRI